MPTQRHPRPDASDPASGTPEGLRRARRAGLAAALVAAAGAGLLGGCATTTGDAPDYVQPASSVPNARVRIVNVHAQAYYAAIGVFDAKACFQLASMGMTGGDSADRERLGMLDEPPPSSATLERRVPAGEPLVVGPRVVFPTATASDILHAMMPAQQAAMRARQAGVCRLPVFTPKAGEQYELRVDLTPGRCSVTPYHLVEHDGLVKREEMSVPASEVYTHEFDMKCFR